MDLGPVPESIWYLDSPRFEVPWMDPEILELRGWVASPYSIENVRLADQGLATEIAIDLHARDDVHVTFPALSTVGFAATVPVSTLGGRRTFDVVYDSGGYTQRIVVPAGDWYQPESTSRLSKRQRIVPLLRCPSCLGDQLTESATSLSCKRCRAVYPASDVNVDFLPDQLRSEFSIVDTANVSSNDYDGIAINIITELHDGLVLDCGAGQKAVYYPNVVNLEIANYPSTDVLAAGERLPFVDNSFDAVLSFAVLEHVKDPATCVSEIARVLRPGGVLYCQVPFLQPKHGYPSHYFNMTSQGLASLLSAFDVRHLGTFPLGEPIFALTWMLNNYAASLPPDVATKFRDMKVSDLMEPGAHYLGMDFVTQVPPITRDVLSCCNYALATKPT